MDRQPSPQLLTEQKPYLIHQFDVMRSALFGATPRGRVAAEFRRINSGALRHFLVAPVQLAVLWFAIAFCSAYAGSTINGLKTIGIRPDILHPDVIESMVGIQHSGKIAKSYAVFSVGRSYTSADWSPDGRYVAASTRPMRNGPVDVWDAALGKKVASLTTDQSSNERTDAEAWSPTGGYIAACTNTSEIRTTVWESQTWKPVTKIHSDPLLGCSALAFSPTGDELVVGTGSMVYPASMTFYSTKTWEQIGKFDIKLARPGAVGVPRIVFTSKSGKLLVGVNRIHGRDDDASLFIFDLVGSIDGSQRPIRSLISWNVYSGTSMTSFAISPNEDQIATNTINGSGSASMHDLQTVSVRIWDGGGNYRLLAAPLDGVDTDAGMSSGLAYSSDGHYLIVGHAGITGEIDLIDARTLKVVDTVHANHVIYAITANPKNPMFAAMTSDGLMMIWRIKEPS